MQSTCTHRASPCSPRSPLVSSIPRSLLTGRAESAPASLFHALTKAPHSTCQRGVTAFVVEAPTAPPVDHPLRFSVEELGAELAWPASFQEQVSLSHVLGTGSYGTVHEGQFDGQVVAVKAMRKGGARNRTTLARFKREASILASLDGVTQVAQLLAKFETPRFVYLVLEKAHGECLSTFVRVRGYATYFWMDVGVPGDSVSSQQSVTYGCVPTEARTSAFRSPGCMCAVRVPHGARRVPQPAHHAWRHQARQFHACQAPRGHPHVRHQPPRAHLEGC